MLKSTVLSAVLATSMLAALPPAFAETTAVPPAASMGTTIPHGAYSVSGISGNELAELAGSAGVSLTQARHMTLSQLSFLKESRDSDTPDVWMGQRSVAE